MPDSFYSYARLADPLLRGFRRAVFEISGFREGDAVLDVACGTGAQTFEYARHGIAATGLDANPEMLRQAGYYFTRFPSLKPVFIQGDATHLPFGNASFDGASISLALHENDRTAQDAIVSEMRRVVKPGGTLVFADFKAPLPRTPLGYSIKLIERVAGEANHHTFRDFEKSGGLSGILARQNLKAQRDRSAAAGTIRLIAVPNNVS